MRVNLSIAKRELFKTALWAGLAGGIAEIVWILIYCHFAQRSAAVVASEVAASFAAGSGFLAMPLGVAIHLLLSMGVGVAYMLVVWRPFAAQLRLVPALMMAVAALALIWAINFSLLLPLVNPQFVDLMPHAVTLVSKILFGISMAWVLSGTSRASIRFGN